MFKKFSYIKKQQTNQIAVIKNTYKERSRTKSAAYA